jgi:hypothetical protein
MNSGEWRECVRIADPVIVTFGALAVALILGANSPPAEAGKVCSRLGLDDNCAKSSDLKGRLDLEQPGKNGRLRVRDQGGEIAVELDARSGHVTNLFSNDPDESNGLVKAWAQINADGTVAACWRCNTDPAETSRLNTGSYEIDFTPLATDITGRPRSATVSGIGIVPVASIRAVDRTTPPDDSTVHIFTENPATGGRIDAPFVLIIY